jgi:hypothetical protein
MLTEAMASERMLILVREHDAEQTLLERDAEERRRRGVTFRELAVEYLEWLEHVKSAKPSTLRDHRLLLAEPGQAYRRGAGSSRGQVIAALGDRPAREVTTREVDHNHRTLPPRPAGGRARRPVHACAHRRVDSRRSVTEANLPRLPADPDGRAVAFTAGAGGTSSRSDRSSSMNSTRSSQPSANPTSASPTHGRAENASIDGTSPTGFGG